MVIQKIDYGKVLSIPFFSTLLAINILAFGSQLKGLETITTLKIVELMNTFLVICFYVLIVTLYFVRTTVKSTTRSLSAKGAAVIGNFMPFFVPLLGGSPARLTSLLLATMITALGLAISVYALSTLGKSFSIIPQARKVVRSGPYRFVKHPLYLGELVATFGIIIDCPSVGKFCLFGGLVAVQIYRALEEEKVLTATLPDYRSYALSRARLIPGVF